MVEVNDVILHILAGANNVTDQVRIVRHFDTQRVLNGPYG